MTKCDICDNTSQNFWCRFCSICNVAINELAAENRINKLRKMKNTNRLLIDDAKKRIAKDYKDILKEFTDD